MMIESIPCIFRNIAMEQPPGPPPTIATCVFMGLSLSFGVRAATNQETILSTVTPAFEYGIYGTCSGRQALGTLSRSHQAKIPTSRDRGDPAFTGCLTRRFAVSKSKLFKNGRYAESADERIE